LHLPCDNTLKCRIKHFYYPKQKAPQDCSQRAAGKYCTGVLPVRKILKQSSRCPLSMEADTSRTLYAPCALSLGTLYKLPKEVQAHSPAQRLALLFKKRATTFKKFSLRLPTDAHQISEFCTGIVEKELINTQD